MCPIGVSENCDCQRSWAVEGEGTGGGVGTCGLKVGWEGGGGWHGSRLGQGEARALCGLVSADIPGNLGSARGSPTLKKKIKKNTFGVYQNARFPYTPKPFFSMPLLVYTKTTRFPRFRIHQKQV